MVAVAHSSTPGLFPRYFRKQPVEFHLIHRTAVRRRLAGRLIRGYWCVAAPIRFSRSAGGGSSRLRRPASAARRIAGWSREKIGSAAAPSTDVSLPAAPTTHARHACARRGADRQLQRLEPAGQALDDRQRHEAAEHHRLRVERQLQHVDRLAQRLDGGVDPCFERLDRRAPAAPPAASGEAWSGSGRSRLS